MAHTYTHNLIHLVFSTKDRQPFIPNEKLPELWKYIVGIGKNHKIYVIAVGGMADHVHILFDLPKTMTLADSARIIKSNSSRWMRVTNRRFSWQDAYGAFGVSESGRDATIAYIVNQAEHHKKRDFKAEYIAMLKKHNVDFDPRYVFA
jgi:putative transposase